MWWAAKPFPPPHFRLSPLLLGGYRGSLSRLTQLLMSWGLLPQILACLGLFSLKSWFEHYLLLEMKSTLSLEYFMAPLNSEATKIMKKTWVTRVFVL